MAHISALDGKPVDLSGMTVNERLLEMGLLDAWDQAARAHDRARMVSILDSVDIGPDTADAVLAKPALYGF